MGIAKTMSAIGKYDFYTKDNFEFIKIISSILKVNLQDIFIDMTSTFACNDKAEEFFDYNFQETYKLTINSHDYDDDIPDPSNIYFTYDLYIPVDFKYEKELTLEFNPNGLFQLNYLPFSNGWNFFIQDIKGLNDHYYTSHNEIVSEILAIRDYYISILKKIKCEEVVIWTDAQYKTEDEFIFKHTPNKSNDLEDIKSSLKVLDNVTLYDFVKSVENKSLFDNRPSLEIAFYDRF